METVIGNGLGAAGFDVDRSIEAAIRIFGTDMGLTNAIGVQGESTIDSGEDAGDIDREELGECTVGGCEFSLDGVGEIKTEDAALIGHVLHEAHLADVGINSGVLDFAVAIEEGVAVGLFAGLLPAEHFGVFDGDRLIEALPLVIGGVEATGEVGGCACILEVVINDLVVVDAIGILVGCDAQVGEGGVIEREAVGLAVEQAVTCQEAVALVGGVVIDG